MARKAIVVKTEKLQEKLKKELSQGKKPTMKTRVYNRCKLCGRNRGYIGYFQVCRICLREQAREGNIMGLRKSSW